MPLATGGSQKVISKNISELDNSKTQAGLNRSHKQNVAIALDLARKSGGGSSHAGVSSGEMERMGRMVGIGKDRRIS